MPQPLNLRFVAPLLLVVALSSTASAQGAPWKDSPYGVNTYINLLGNLRNENGGPRTVGGGGPRELSSYASIDAIGGDQYTLLDAKGKARASLIEGTIGAETSAAAEGEYGAGAYVSSLTAQVQLWDTITITAGEGLNFGRIPLQLELDGSTTGTGSRAIGSLIIWDYTENREVVRYISPNQYGSFTMNTTLGSEDQVVAPLTSRKYQVWFSLQTYSSYSKIESGSTSADFLNTLHFRWSLPQGTTAASESGVFTPASIQAVPEPATFGVLAIGAAAMLRRRKRR